MNQLGLLEDIYSLIKEYINEELKESEKAYDELQNRIDKAVGYIEKNYDFYYGNDLIDEYQEIVDILQGYK